MMKNLREVVYKIIKIRKSKRNGIVINIAKFIKHPFEVLL